MSLTSLEHVFQAEDGPIAYARFGAGEPLILVHGIPSRAHLWRKVAPHLSDKFEVFLFDMAGYGQSSWSDGRDLRLRAHARNLAALCRHWGVARPHFVGHDFGGATVLGAHLVEGVEIASLTVIDPVALTPWGTPYARLVNASPDVFRQLPDYVLRAIAAAHLRTATVHPLSEAEMQPYLDQWDGETGRRAYVDHMAQFDPAFTDDMKPLYGNIAAPTQILWGEQDAWLPPANGERLAALIPEARLEFLPDAGHFAMEDCPVTIARRIRDHAIGAR